MWVLFVPILIILVLLLTVGSLFAGLFWLVGSAWPWLLIGLGAWLFWHEDGQHRRRYRRQHAQSWISTAVSTPASAPEKVSRPQKKRTLRPPELPVDMQVKVEQIRRKADVLLGYADRFPPF